MVAAPANAGHPPPPPPPPPLDSEGFFSGNHQRRANLARGPSPARWTQRCPSTYLPMGHRDQAAALHGASRSGGGAWGGGQTGSERGKAEVSPMSAAGSANLASSLAPWQNWRASPVPRGLCLGRHGQLGGLHPEQRSPARGPNWS